jgi:hypothetical protein
MDQALTEQARQVSPEGASVGEVKSYALPDHFIPTG